MRAFRSHWASNDTGIICNPFNACLFFMRAFEFHWMNGTVDIGHGYDVSNALINLGYDEGMIIALDYYKEITDSEEDDKIE